MRLNSEQVCIEVAMLELPVKQPLSAIEVIQYRYGNSEYAVCYNIDPADLFLMDLNQIEAYSLDIFAKLNAHYLSQLKQPKPVS